MRKLCIWTIAANRFAVCLGMALLIAIPASFFEHWVVVTIHGSVQDSGSHAESRDLAALEAKYGRLPLSFEPNVGQVDNEVAFVARGNGANVFLTADGAVLDFGARYRRIGGRRTLMGLRKQLPTGYSA